MIDAPGSGKAPDQEAPPKILDLVERFQRNLDSYKKSAYNETQVRREFIDPFFEALGWDVDNKQGYAEAYKDVIHEDAIKIAGHSRAPDYSFRIGGARKFFVEAKKPAINLRDDAEGAYQLRRYAWSAKLPLSILSNFEELTVYDCRVKPDKADKASHSRVLALKYTDYRQRWEEIAGIFSREAILKGSFDKYAESKKLKKGTAEVDAAFLAEIERWREMLARNLALRNPGLTPRQLNYAVQLTIDRIIFLRICEDRGIEPYGRLMALQNGERVYKRLFEWFDRADIRYNSGLFHFKPEKGRASPVDALTPHLTIDDKVLKDIFKNLYYPDSPYEFSVLPVDLLGQVYEQFLGKVIRLTAGHRAVVEYKPEVRKAGGVYYTPTYIVDYIVRQTVGQLLEGRKPGPRKGAGRLKILDPACGSGSFLLGAYQFLLDWHLKAYMEDDPHKWASGRTPRLYPTAGGGWKLTINERKRLLLEHLYGVDIDAQAVEVTKLSLLLKILEGEDEQSVGQESMFHRVLPDLGDNIKCGNSLIGPDYYHGRQLTLTDDEETYRINAFDWQAEFPEIMAAGGFDAVIGNPPYLFGRDWKALNINDDIKKYLGGKYKSSPYQLDMFSVFMEKASQLCKTFGYIGQIVPNVWLTNTYSSSTRAFILGQARDLCIMVPPPKCFLTLTIDTIVYTFQKINKYDKFFKIAKMHNGNIIEIAKHNTEEYLEGLKPISTALDNERYSLVSGLKNNFPELKSVAKITRGVHPYRIGGYGKTAFGSGPQTSRDVKERPYHSTVKKEGFSSFIYGHDLVRFSPPVPAEYVKYGPWLAEPRQPEFFQGDRVYSRKILGERLVVTVEQTNSVADQQVYITIPIIDKLRAQYLAGILGSKLISFFIRGFYSEANDAFPQIKVRQLKELPIRTIDFTDPTDKARHDRMVEMVENMLAWHKQLAATALPQEKAVLKRQIASTDRLIDRLVYELYGLTEEEIRLVEEGAKVHQADPENE